MRSRWMRALAFLFAITCAWAPPASPPPLVALTAGLQSHGHDHAVALHSDRGHHDLVFSHADGHSHDHGARGDEPRRTAVSESDHVVHLTSGAARNATPLRPAARHALAVVSYQRAPSVPAARWPAPRASELRSRGPEPSRSVILRI